MPLSPPTPSSRRALVARVLLAAMCAGGLSGGLASLLLVSLDHQEPALHVAVMLGALLAAFASLLVSMAVLGRRLGRLVRLARRAEGVSDNDEDLGRAIAAVDRLLAQAELGVALAASEATSATPPTLREESGSFRPPPREGPLERDPELEATLASRTLELEQRLRERALLFDLLRESVSSLDLEVLLERLANRLGPALELRELVVLVKDAEGRFVVRASWGFATERALVGRALDEGQGVTSASIATGRSVVIDDVSAAPDYLAFWGEVPRSGSFMSVPIRLRDEVIGALALTRPPHDPLTELEARFLSALADQIALAIHNAQLFARLEELSTIDELTRLPNRRYLHARLEREMADARRYGHPLSLLMIDIDHFKKLNDRAGHPVGDEALVAVSTRLRAALRDVDTVTRWGGEEFVVLLSHTGQREAAQVAEKLRRAILAIDAPWAREQPGGHLSLSIGVAELAPGEDGPALVQRADRAVYVAKRAGRNRVSSPATPSPLAEASGKAAPRDPER